DVETRFDVGGLWSLGVLQWCHVLADVETRPPMGGDEQRHRGFNGATSSRTWKRRPTRRSSAPSPRFNGATPSRTWKLGSGGTWGTTCSSQLQWCHVLADVETGSCTTARLLRCASCFNGATSSRTWKLRREVMMHEHGTASMVPRPRG